MYKLFNVLKAILLGQSKTHQEEDDATNIPTSTVRNVEVPPPQMVGGYDLSGGHSPSRDGYDPKKETTAISTPLHDTIQFYNIYRSHEGWELLDQKCEFILTGLDGPAVKATGAINEFNALFTYLKSCPDDYLFRIYKIKGYLVLCAYNAVNDNFEWYYSTLLELPEGRFNPIIVTIRKPAKPDNKKELEYWADHRNDNNGERG